MLWALGTLEVMMGALCPLSGEVRYVQSSGHSLGCFTFPEAFLSHVDLG